MLRPLLAVLLGVIFLKETKNNDIVESTLDESVYDTIVRAIAIL